MREENDWRLTNQQSYLHGVALRRRKYSPPNDEWEHDHCAFCWAKFMSGGGPEALREGYADEGERHWICERCYEDFQDLFDWRVIQPER
jgi:hypothetical protein